MESELNELLKGGRDDNAKDQGRPRKLAGDNSLFARLRQVFGHQKCVSARPEEVRHHANKDWHVAVKESALFPGQCE